MKLRFVAQVYLACTPDMPERAGNPVDLRIRLAGTSLRSRRYSGRSRGDLPARASAAMRRGFLRRQREDHGRSTVPELEPAHRCDTAACPRPYGGDRAATESN